MCCFVPEVVCEEVGAWHGPLAGLMHLQVFSADDAGCMPAVSGEARMVSERLCFSCQQHISCFVLSLVTLHACEHTCSFP